MACDDGIEAFFSAGKSGHVCLSGFAPALEKQKPCGSLSGARGIIDAQNTAWWHLHCRSEIRVG